MLDEDRSKCLNRVLETNIIDDYPLGNELLFQNVRQQTAEKTTRRMRKLDKPTYITK